VKYILAADIGGTKLATALFTTDGELLKSHEIKSDNENGEKLFEGLVQSFNTLCTQSNIAIEQIERIAIGLPGIVDAANGIAVYQNNLPWKEFGITESLSKIFPGSQITVDNDVYMAAWGEYATRGYTRETLVYVTLSTGISCCTIHNGQFLRGAGMAGEIGFSLVDEADSTLESHVSGPALEMKGQSKFSNPELSLKEMMEFYYQGDERIIETMKAAITALAKEVHHILVYSDPHCVVLGGGIFNHHPELVLAVRKEVSTYLTHPLFKGKENRIEASIFKGDAGLRGAAYRVIN
jgi:glucokinase